MPEEDTETPPIFAARAVSAPVSAESVMLLPTVTSPEIAAEVAVSPEVVSEFEPSPTVRPEAVSVVEEDPFDTVIPVAETVIVLVPFVTVRPSDVRVEDFEPFSATTEPVVVTPSSVTVVLPVVNDSEVMPSAAIVVTVSPSPTVTESVAARVFAEMFSVVATLIVPSSARVTAMLSPEARFNLPPAATFDSFPSTVAVKPEPAVSV